MHRRCRALMGSRTYDATGQKGQQLGALYSALVSHRPDSGGCVCGRGFLYRSCTAYHTVAKACYDLNLYVEGSLARLETWSTLSQALDTAQAGSNLLLGLDHAMTTHQEYMPGQGSALGAVSQTGARGQLRCFPKTTLDHGNASKCFSARAL